jgi:hypothetical protein
MRACLLSTIVGVGIILATTAQAAPKKVSTSARMNQIIGAVCNNVGYANGGYAFRSYDPAAYTRREARKQIRTDMQNFEQKGISFKTVTGAAKVKSQLSTAFALAENDPQSVNTLNWAIDEFKKLGVLQDVVYRGITGGKAFGYTYYSIPHQVYFCLKTPTGKGKRLEAFLEQGD